MKNRIVPVIVALLLSCSAVNHLEAAPNQPIELLADSIQYDSVSGTMVAQGNVRMTQDNGVMTGNTGQYNTKTKEAHMTGGVQVVKDDATLQAEDVRSYENTHVIATGNPVLTKGEDKLVGPQIDYYSDKQYAIAIGGAKLTMPDGVMTGTQIEAFFPENRAVAQGNVHIVSPQRNLDAVSDQAVYYGDKDKQGKTVLTGNVKAVQDGNVLTGNTMTLYLDNKVVDVEGRSKLVIIPQ
jgi:lipopolysaccharide export system protein LptA